MKNLICTLIFTMALFAAQAQIGYQISHFKVGITGTSTMHDWKAEVTKVSGTANMEITGGELTAITDLWVKMEAGSIKSEKGNMMDKNIYKALDTKAHPNITFKMKKVKNLSATGKTTNVVLEGDLTIAGQSKTVTLSANGISNNGVCTFSGNHKLKMTDYKVQPPEFMLGAMKTGDEVTISYEVTLSNNGISQK